MQQMNTPTKAFLAATCTAFIALVLFLDLQMIKTARKVTHARDHWSTVDGDVISSTVKKRRGAKGPIYQTKVRYTYEVGGATLEGDRYGFTEPRHYKRSSMDYIANLYPSGQPTVVHYDPADPAQAVLDVDFETVPVFFLLGMVPVNLLASGLLFLLWALFGPSSGERKPQAEDDVEREQLTSPVFWSYFIGGGLPLVSLVGLSALAPQHVANRATMPILGVTAALAVAAYVVAAAKNKNAREHEAQPRSALRIADPT